MNRLIPQLTQPEAQLLSRLCDLVLAVNQA